MLSSEFTKIRNQYREIVRPFEKEIAKCRQEFHLPIGLWEILTNARLFERGLEYKGEDGLYYLAPALEGISYGLLDVGLSVSLIAHLALGLNTLNKYCHDEIKKNCLDLVINQNKVLALSISEPHGGSDLRNIETKLISHKDGYLLKGHKWLATNGPIADFILVLCIEEATRETACVIVESNWKGVEKKRIFPLGLQTSSLGQFTFHDVFVPKTHILGKIGDGLKIVNEALIRERLMMPFGCIGSSERVLDILLEYIPNRSIFNHPIAEYQYIRKRITDIITNLETTRGVAHLGLEMFRQDNDVNLIASICKHYASSRGVDSCIHAIQTMGSYGLLPNSIGEHLLSIVATTIAGGTEEVQRETIFSEAYRRFRKNKRSVSSG